MHKKTISAIRTNININPDRTLSKGAIETLLLYHYFYQKYNVMGTIKYIFNMHIHLKIMKLASKVWRIHKINDKYCQSYKTLTMSVVFIYP